MFRLDNNDLCIHDATRKLEERRPFTPEDINKLLRMQSTMAGQGLQKLGQHERAAQVQSVMDQSAASSALLAG